MRNRTAMTITAAAILALATTAGAADRGHDAALLESERQELAWQAQNAKGIDATQLRQEEDRVQDLIDGLQRGDHVDTDAIDRVLNRTY